MESTTTLPATRRIPSAGPSSARPGIWRRSRPGGRPRRSTAAPTSSDWGASSVRSSPDPRRFGATAPPMPGAGPPRGTPPRRWSGSNPPAAPSLWCGLPAAASPPIAPRGLPMRGPSLTSSWRTSRAGSAGRSSNSCGSSISRSTCSASPASTGSSAASTTTSTACWGTPSPSCSRSASSTSSITRIARRP